MDGEAPNVPASNLTSTTHNSTFTSSSSSSSSSGDFLRDVEAAFKRHRPIPIGTMQSSKLLPRRIVPPPPQPQPHKETLEPTSKPKEDSAPVNQDIATLSPPHFSGTITNIYHHQHPPPPNSSSTLAHHLINNVDPINRHSHLAEPSKKVKFSFPTSGSAVSQGADAQMATRMDNLSSHMDSLALTEMDWELVHQPHFSNFKANQSKHQNAATTDADGVFRADGGSFGLAVNQSSRQNQLHHLRDFLHTDVNHPMTQSSMVGSSCATTTSVHAVSAPRLNSTTHSSCPHQDSSAVRSSADANIRSQNIALGDGVQQAYPASMPGIGADVDRVLSGGLASSSAANASIEVKDIQCCNLLQRCQAQTDRSQTQGESVKAQIDEGADASRIPPSCPSSKDQPSIAQIDPTKSDKQAKASSRKKGYDPDLFFKVSGKLYQRLGKIGSGGSSEVHKVISSDCTIYALKKIKLKGRDYATAYGFCQEILYLKKLKGKDNIIQLIDYEVTDKALLHAVMNDSISNKESRVKDDGYIYMVLEYGEIDLAHMLSQKWKEIDASNSTMDENWLRFYWQQILQAVNTIHEERIVHSDLKPANFLLVKGSLKLIDFGIAKAIMSDTTNIQRDAQVGTLSYMSPEAFMCNESDADGKTIKCGRPSDIWSLGCILYQMVYGRTPFSEYKSFWAKFKVITDPNHEIIYGPVSNPWLMDLMKKCLAWDRNERWRIPELLKHPFLVPPIQQQLFPAQEQNCKFIQLITESYPNDEKVSNLCTKFQTILGQGDSAAASQDQQFRLLSQISSICQQLQEHITEIS